MGRAAGTHPGVVPLGTSRGLRPPVRLALDEVPWSFLALVAPQASRRLAIRALALFPNHCVITRPWETTNPWAASDPCSVLGAQVPVRLSNLSPCWKRQDEPRTKAPTSAWKAQQGAPGSIEVPGERVGGAPPLTAAQGRHPTHQRQLPRDVQGLRRTNSMVFLLAKPATFPFFHIFLLLPWALGCLIFLLSSLELKA